MLPARQAFFRVTELDPEMLEAELEDVERSDPRSEVLVGLRVTRKRRRKHVRVQTRREEDVFDFGQARIDPLLERAKVFERSRCVCRGRGRRR